MMIYMYLRSIEISAASSSTKVLHLFFPNKAWILFTDSKVEIFFDGQYWPQGMIAVVKAHRLLLVD